jgi:hypothetical protein
MSTPSNRPPVASGKPGTSPARPSVVGGIFRVLAAHPRAVLIGAAIILGLTVILENWRPTKATLLVTDVSLPFMVWAIIFMALGYGTGKWIEWAWEQRRIRKGIYRPRLSPGALAAASVSLEERLEERLEKAPTEPGPAPQGTVSDTEPMTIIDRGPGAEPPVPKAGEVAVSSPPPGVGFSPAAEQAATAAPPPASGRRYEDYGDYDDYGDGGAPRRGAGGRRYGDYSDYADYDDGAARRGRRR